MTQRQSDLVVYFGRHKAASRYISSVLQTIAANSGQTFANVSEPESRSRDWAIRTLPASVDIVRASPYPSDIRAALERYRIPFRGFHVYRDPRDMIVSGYFSHKNSHPERWQFQADHFSLLNTVDKHAGLMAEIQYSGWLEFDDMLAWDYSASHIVNIKFEDLVRAPEETWAKIFQFCRLELPPGLLKAALEKINFSSLSEGRAPGQEDPNSHYRKGVPGDWKEHLTPEHLEVFQDSYGELLNLLGYE